MRDSRVVVGVRGARPGFSLLEMLVVIVIMGLLAALVLPRVMDNVGKAAVNTTKVQIESLAGAVDQFYLNVGRVPTEDEGLSVLLTAPTSTEDAEAWDGPYLTKNFIPKDGWKHAFEYIIPEDGRFLIRSLGADGRIGGEGKDADLDNRNT